MANVLIACEESQRVCTAFRKRGHRAFSCDILPCSGGHPEWHIQGDVLPLIDGYCEFYTQDGLPHWQRERWDILIAHPPCTYMSRAGACRMYRVIDDCRYIVVERYKKMLSGREFFFKILRADCDRIAVENPTPLKLCQLPDPSQIIQPYQFGHPYSKRTLLWLKGLPPLRPTAIIDKYTPYLPSNTSSFARGGGGSRGATTGSKNFSKTFEGVAEAMAEQWGALLDGGADTDANDTVRCVEPTADIDTFCVDRGIACDGEKSVWYKAVRKRDGRYIADFDNETVYEIGEVTIANDLDDCRYNECGAGINIAPLRLAVDYGKDWSDLAIIEVEAVTDDIVLPYHSDGKVRVDKVRTVREVPLDECGVLGQMLARKRKEGNE